MGSPLSAMSGVTDHVHMLVSLAKTVALSYVMLNIKRDSSKWIKATDFALGAFGQQDGYVGFSIGEQGVDARRTYIAEQKVYHKTIDFKSELRVFLYKCCIE